MHHQYPAATISTGAPRSTASTYFLLAFASVGLFVLLIFSLRITISPPPTILPANTAAAPLTVESTADVQEVVSLALDFKAMLSTDQQSTLQLNFTEARAQAWSNLPCGSNCRNGVQFSNLTEDQLTAALAVIAAAAGDRDGEGLPEFEAIRQAEEALQALGANGYDEGIFFLAFLNKPSTTDAWMLQYGGHHYAMNIAFNQGQVVGPTPHFEGVEPLSYTVDGTNYAPLTEEHDALVALLSSLSSEEQSTASLSAAFNDILLGPDEDGNFPETKVGVRVGDLSEDQQALVMAAMEPWVKDIDSATSTALLNIYEKELADTYLAYSGNIDLNSNADYARIDGPSVWIEFVCQNGVVIRNQIHYHTIWRDHSRDYGGYLTATSLGDTKSTSLFEPLRAGRITTFPNPAVATVYFDVREPLTDASLTIFDVTGKEILRRERLTGEIVEADVSELPRGSYLVHILDGNRLYTGKIQK